MSGKGSLMVFLFPGKEGEFEKSIKLPFPKYGNKNPVASRSAKA
jgi:hypothetical protein